MKILEALHTAKKEVNSRDSFRYVVYNPQSPNMDWRNRYELRLSYEVRSDDNGNIVGALFRVTYTVKNRVRVARLRRKE